MMFPIDQNLWADADWTTFRALLDRHKRLARHIVALVIQKHGGFSARIGWIALEFFEPGSREIQVDGDLNVTDVEILRELLALPSMTYENIETFDWKPFEDLRSRLVLEVGGKGMEPCPEPRRDCEQR